MPGAHRIRGALVQAPTLAIDREVAADNGCIQTQLASQAGAQWNDIGRCRRRRRTVGVMAGRCGAAVGTRRRRDSQLQRLQRLPASHALAPEQGVAGDDAVLLQPPQASQVHWPFTLAVTGVVPLCFLH
ncbi:hypothetical protein D3C73_1124100 [compost metagenome]